MFESLFAGLQELEIRFLYEANEQYLVLRLHANEPGEFLVRVTKENEFFVFRTSVLTREQGPAPAVEQLSRVLLSKQPAGRCHYCFDEQQNVVIRLVVSVFRHRSAFASETLSRIIDEIRAERSTFLRKILSDCPLAEGNLVVLFPARLQPPHTGHFEAIQMLLEGDERILARSNDDEQRRLLRGIGKVVISLGPTDGQAGNPLTVHQRRDLVEFELANNPVLNKHRYRIQVVGSPSTSHDRYWLLSLIAQIGQIDAVASANSATIQTASYLKVPVLHVHRKGGVSGTAVRKSCVAQDWEQLRRYLTESVFRRCEEKNLFDVIRNYEDSK